MGRIAILHTSTKKFTIDEHGSGKDKNNADRNLLRGSDESTTELTGRLVVGDTIGGIDSSDNKWHSMKRQQRKPNQVGTFPSGKVMVQGHGGFCNNFLVIENPNPLLQPISTGSSPLSRFGLGKSQTVENSKGKSQSRDCESMKDPMSLRRPGRAANNTCRKHRRNSSKQSGKRQRNRSLG